MKHTKGNWYPVNYAGYWMIQKGPRYKPNYDILDADNVGEKTAEANAKLIASAPELLETCKEVIRLKKLIEYPIDPTPENADEMLAISNMIQW